MDRMEATLAHVAVGCNAATNALCVRPTTRPPASGSFNYCGAFAAKNVVCLLRSGACSVDDAPDSAPLAVAQTLKHRDATSDASRLTSVTLQCDAQSDSARVLAGDSDGRVFLWSQAAADTWQLQRLTHDAQPLPAVAVAAVATAETQRRRLHFAAFSDGTLVVFGQSKGSEEVKLLSRLELGVQSIMEAVEALVVRREGEEEEESVLLAAGGVDAKVRLLEVAGGSDQLTELLALEGHRGWIRSLAFMQQKMGDAGDAVAMLASASQDQRIRVWKVTARSRGGDDACPPGEVKDGFLAHGEHTTYTVSFDALLVGHEDWVTSVQWTQLPRDDEREDSCESALLSSSMDNTLIVWTKSADTRSSWTPSLRVGEVGGNGLLSAGVLPARGARLSLVSLNFGGQLERWEQQPAPSTLFLPAISVNGHCAEVTDLSWSPRGDYLVSVSLDQTARVLAPSKTAKNTRQQLPDWYEISRAQVHGYDINCGCFVLGNRAANDQFVSGADEKILRVFEAPDEVKQLVGRLNLSDKNNANPEKQVRTVQHAYLPELSLTNKSAAAEARDSNSENGYAELTSSVTLPVGDTLCRKTLWPEQRKLYGHGNELLCVSSSHAGDLIASACKSREERYAAVRLWNTADCSEAQIPLEGHKSSVVQLSFSPSDQYLLSVSRDRQFCLYERQPNSDGKFALVKSVKAHRRIIWSCSWSPDSSLFVLGSRDQSFSLWGRTREKWDRVCDPMAFDAAVTAVAFLPSVLPNYENSGAYVLAVGLETGAIELFTVSVVGEDATCTAVTCSRIGELAWEIAPSAAVLRLAWCPAKNEGEYVLAAASSDSSVRVYNLNI